MALRVRLRVPHPTEVGWETGETEFWLAPRVSTDVFTRVVTAFLRRREQAVMLVLDRAGWHVSAETLALEADGVLALRHLPAYSPELMPAECLWALTDERLANRVFADISALEAVLAETCVSLRGQRERLRRRTLYHWWPGGADHTETD